MPQTQTRGSRALGAKCQDQRLSSDRYVTCVVAQASTSRLRSAQLSFIALCACLLLPFRYHPIHGESKAAAGVPEGSSRIECLGTW